MQLPAYKLIGGPERYVNGRGRKDRHYRQKFRLLDEPLRAVRSVSLRTKDVGVARRRATEIVEQRIRAIVLARDPQARTAANGVRVALDEYLDDLAALGNTSKQTRLVRTRIERLISECSWTEYQQVDSVSAIQAVSQLRTDGTIKTLATANKYREALRAWSRWMKKNGRWPANLLEDMPKIKGDTTPARRRAILTDSQFNILLTKTRTAPPRRNLTGEQRFWLYLIASQTGLRAQELNSVAPSNFHLDGEQPFVQIHCTVSKRRKTDRIELHREFAEMLADWLKDKPNDVPLWSNSKSWYYKGGELVRADLEFSGIPSEIDTDDGKAVIDFHSFRCYRVTKAILTGTNSRVVRSIARLSSEALLDRYCKIPQSEVSECVNAISPPQTLFDSMK